jgi:hypothetical protein
LKYKAIDGHGRNEGFRKAYKEGGVIAQKEVGPGDARWTTVKVQVRFFYTKYFGHR